MDARDSGILPNILFYWIIIVVMLPNIVLCFTEGMTPVQNATDILLPLGVYMLIMCSSARVGRMVLWLLLPVFLAGFEMVLLYLYGNSVIAVDMWLNLVTTNSHEAVELLSNLLPALLLVGLLYFTPIAGAITALIRGWSISPKFRNINRRIAWVATISGLLCMAMSYMSTRPYSPLRDLFPVNALCNAVIAVQRFAAAERYHETSSSYTFDAVATHPDNLTEVYVLIIGETSRADHWEMSGYTRPTNPGWRDIDGLVNFPYAMSESNTTHKSVPLLLSPLSASGFADSINHVKSLITAFREAGFHTSFFSCQQPNHSYIDFFAHEADTCIFIRDDMVSRTAIDQDLLPYLTRQLQDNYPRQLIVLHTYGSHFSYSDRYTAADAVFRPDAPIAADISHRRELINAYDNTIVATWRLIRSVIEAVDSPGTVSAVLYTSDHGEDLYDDSRHLLLHASPRPSFYQLHVPFLIWLSDDYRRLYPSVYTALRDNSLKNVSSSEAFFHTALSLAGIRARQLNDSLSVAGSWYTPRSRMYLDDHNQGVPLVRSGLTDADLGAMSAAGISLP